MQFPAHRQIPMVITVLLFLLATQATASDFDQLSETETTQKWGRVLFCQRIYSLSEVKPRLYSFDTKQCDKAGQLMTDLVGKYTEQQQALLNIQAESHARDLSFNTREPYQAVGACRDYCQKLAEIYDQRTNTSNKQ